MSIEYSYEIINVDEQARCMEVVYTAEGHQTLNIGARLPFVGENLEDVIYMYAPIRFWEEQQTPVVVPAVGIRGVSVPVNTDVLSQENAEVALNQPEITITPVQL